MGLLDLPARAEVDDDGVDPGAGEQVGQHQPGGAAADDADGGAGDRRAWSDMAPTGRPRTPSEPCALPPSGSGRRSSTSGRCRGRRPAWRRPACARSLPQAGDHDARARRRHRPGRGSAPRPSRPRGSSPPPWSRSRRGAPARAGGAESPGWLIGVRRDAGQVGRAPRPGPPAGAWASSTLPTPVACIGSREPIVLTTGTEAWPGEPVEVEHLGAVAHGEVHGGEGGAVEVMEVRRGHLPQPRLHGREQADVPQPPPHDVLPRRRAAQRTPLAPARRPAGGPSARAARPAPPARSGSAAGAPRRTRQQRQRPARDRRARSRDVARHPPILPLTGSDSGSVQTSSTWLRSATNDVPRDVVEVGLCDPFDDVRARPAVSRPGRPPRGGGGRGRWPGPGRRAGRRARRRRSPRGRRCLR